MTEKYILLFADEASNFYDLFGLNKNKWEEYSYPCHCRWNGRVKNYQDQLHVDPAAIFKEFALYQEENK